MENEILTNGEGLTQISEEFYMNETNIFHKVENKFYPITHANDWKFWDSLADIEEDFKINC
jgi:hypothetical protein